MLDHGCRRSRLEHTPCYLMQTRHVAKRKARDESRSPVLPHRHAVATNDDDDEALRDMRAQAWTNGCVVA